jgi:sec-independent protein translocase protein TatC
MPRKNEKDLFADSTMTFGEHLQELQKCLWKAILGLMVGFAIGLYFSTDVVAYIQQPVTKALTHYYEKESREKLSKELNPRTDNLIGQSRMFPQEVFLDPGELAVQLKAAYPGEFANLPNSNQLKTPENPEGMIRLFLWHYQRDDMRVRTKGLGMQEPFTIFVKASLLVGAILASPWILYQLWLFIGAGLYPRERQYVRLYFPMSVGLFLLGAGLAFFFVFEPVLEFLLKFNRWMAIDPEPRINEWLSFMMILPLGFGAGFQLPLVMFFLERIGAVTVESYLKQWKIWVASIIILSAVLTPPDAYSMTFLAVSLVFLFFGGILLCKVVPKKKSDFESLDS